MKGIGTRFAVVGSLVSALSATALLARRAFGRREPARSSRLGSRHAAAFRAGEPAPRGEGSAVRSAGPEAMRDPARNWDAVDEASDESFPASDPSAKY